MTLIIFYKYGGDVDVRECSKISILDDHLDCVGKNSTESAIWYSMSNMKRIVVDGVTIWEAENAEN